MKIPQKGMSKDEIFGRLGDYRSRDLDWQSGRVFGYIFDPGPEVRDVAKEAYGMFLTENGLDFTAFPSLLRLERELVGMMRHHLNGDEEVVGNFTSGGTESIILAVKSARDYFRAKKPQIKEPEIILPATAHAAFHKAARYLGVKVVQVPVDPASYKADVKAIAEAIGPNTILIVGSAPSYTHGVIDPIREMAALALEKEILFHCDACVGGFMLPYFRRLGASVPEFDFSVPGVTSISVDLHKYAYAAKGASIILYRNKNIRRYQIFACSHWTGYTVVNNAVQSSKSGGPMAAAWAVINYIGDEGYLEFARKKLEATRKVVEGIEQIDGLRILGKPEMCLVAFTSDEVNVFQIIDEMNSKGWYIQPALSYGNSPRHIHMSINVSNVDWIDQFLSDLAGAVEEARQSKSDESSEQLRQMISSIDFSSMSEEDFASLLQLAGIDGEALPERMADINEIMDLLSPETREQLLVEYVNNLFV